MFNFSTKQVDELFNSHSSLHSEYGKRFDYFHGKHKFLRTEVNLDGSAKSNTTTNFCEYVVKAHTAVATTNPYQFVLNTNPNEDPNIDPRSNALDELDKVIAENDVNTIDVEHYKSCLICGVSVELHSVDAGKIKITQRDPRHWAFLYDENGNVIVGINKVKLAKNTIFQGSLLTSDHTLTTVYEPDQIWQYLTNSKSRTPIFSSTTPNPYGKVPVVVFSITSDKRPLLSDVLLKLNDQFNVLNNSRVEEILYNVDSFAMIQGMDPTDSDLMQKVKASIQDRMVILPDDKTKFSFVSKGGSEALKYQQALSDAFLAIHNQAMIPDLRDIQGATGIASGLALQMKFLPTKQSFGFFKKYIEKGLRERIDLLNTIWFLRSLPLLEDYRINIQMFLPTDDAAIRSSLKEMLGILSHKKILELMPDVDDPEAELEALAQEKGNQPAPVEQSPDIEDPIKNQPARMKTKEEVIENASKKMAAMLNNHLKSEATKITDSKVVDNFIKSRGKI